jgi:hypothetical protein
MERPISSAWGKLEAAIKADVDKALAADPRGAKLRHQILTFVRDAFFEGAVAAWHHASTFGTIVPNDEDCRVVVEAIARELAGPAPIGEGGGD